MTPPCQRSGRVFDPDDPLDLAEWCLGLLCSDAAEHDLSGCRDELLRFSGALDLFAMRVRFVLASSGIDVWHLRDTVGPAWISDVVATLAGCGVGIWDGRWHDAGALRAANGWPVTGLAPDAFALRLRIELSMWVDGTGGGHLAEVAADICDELGLVEMPYPKESNNV